MPTGAEIILPWWLFVLMLALAVLALLDRLFELLQARVRKRGARNGREQAVETRADEPEQHDRTAAEGKAINHSRSEKAALFTGINSILSGVIIIIISAYDQISKVILPTHGWIPWLADRSAEEHH